MSAPIDVLEEMDHAAERLGGTVYAADIRKTRAAVAARRNGESGVTDFNIPREAVEAALTAFANVPQAMHEDAELALMQAAIAAALPLILGEPVAWKAGVEFFRRHEAAQRHVDAWRLYGTPIIPLYAPSIRPTKEPTL